MKTPKVLVVATSHKTRGGITSVIKSHQTGNQWNKYQCKWIETHIDKNTIYKILYCIKGFLSYVFLLPFYDIIHIHLAAVERKIPFIFLAFLFRKKIIIHLHIPDPNTTIFSRKKNLYGWCFTKANIVIVLSKYWQQLLKDNYHINNIRIVYNPCPIVIRKKRIESNIILYAGTITERKGYIDLLYAFASIAKKYPQWSLIFAGNGNIKTGIQLAQTLGIKENVNFIGWMKGKEKEEIFQKASVYCLPSYAEGFPMGVLDAWAYGIPVICTPVGGLSDIVKDGINCLTFTPGNQIELSNKIELFIKDPSLREKLHQASIELASNTFCAQTVNHIIENIYSELYDNKSIKS